MSVVKIAEEQYGFTPDNGTQNAFFVLRRLAERFIEVQRDLFVCSVDYIEALDKVQHEPLITLLDSLDVD